MSSETKAPISKSNAKLLLYLVTAICLLGIALLRNRDQNTEAPSSHEEYTKLSGIIFHTEYHIQYADSTNYNKQIQQLFREFDGSLSMFNDTSLITRVNRCDETVVANHYLRTVFEKGQEISRLTQGSYDMTVAPLVNLWGFGFKNADNISQQAIDSILQFVGYEKIRLDADGHFHKDDPRVILDASSIAKGYMCDIIANFLAQQGVSSYMVEIGGEIACAGHNPKGELWSIGINEPSLDSLQTNNVLRDILYLTDCGMATSGNYRRFYEKDGKRYAHTIDPADGYPVQKDILSSTVIAPDCMTADALATAFMVIGSQRAMQIVEADTTLMAYFICSQPDQENLQIIYSPKLKDKLASQNKSN